MGFRSTNTDLGACLPAPLTEEGIEGVLSPTPQDIVTWHLLIRPEALFQAVELSVGITNLDASPAGVEKMHSCMVAALQLPPGSR